MDYAGQQQADIEVSVSALPVGKYTAHLQLLDASAGVLSETAVPFARREEPDWWANRERYGTQPEVPPPWSPMSPKHWITLIRGAWFIGMSSPPTF